MGSIIGDEEIQEIEGYGGSGGSSAIGWGGDYYPLSSMVLVLFFQEKYKIVTSS